jgi:hypothetical protein
MDAAELFGHLDLNSDGRLARSELFEAAILIIDPQKSFTQGAWMRSIGAGADIDVSPIRMAFENCTEVLRRHYCNLPIIN